MEGKVKVVETERGNTCTVAEYYVRCKGSAFVSNGFDGKMEDAGSGWTRLMRNLESFCFLFLFLGYFWGKYINP